MMESRPASSISKRSIPLIILDSNCRNIYGKLSEVNKLQNWQERGLIELRVTEAFYREQNLLGRQHASKFNLAIPEPMVLGLELGAASFLGGNFYLADSLTLPFRGVAAIMFPGREKLNKNQQNDVMHILAAHRVNAEIFVTNDEKDFIKDGRMELFREIGLYIMKPADAVLHLHSVYQWV